MLVSYFQKSLHLNNFISKMRLLYKGNKCAGFSPFIFPYLLSNLVYLAVFLDRLTDLWGLLQLGSLFFQLLIWLGQWNQGERDWFVGKEVEGFISLASSFKGPWLANGCVPLLEQWLLSDGPLLCLVSGQIQTSCPFRLRWESGF